MDRPVKKTQFSPALRLRKLAQELLSPSPFFEKGRESSSDELQVLELHQTLESTIRNSIHGKDAFLGTSHKQLEKLCSSHKIIKPNSEPIKDSKVVDALMVLKELKKNKTPSLKSD